jgi:hypothetical protein
MFRTSFTPIAALTAVAFLACGKPGETSQSADSTARNLTLAPTESTVALKDVPALGAVPAKPTPAKKAPAAPKPAAPVPAQLMLAAGTRVPLAAGDTITTRSAKAGDAFTATVSQDVRDAAGQVVIPAGATVSGTITAAEPAPNPSSVGKLELTISSVSVRGTSYPIDASVVGVDTVMKGRGVTGADVAKVGAGAAAGAILGKIIGKNTKGAIIGGAAGAAAGAAAARVSRDIDVVIPKGAAITIQLNGPLTVKRS